MRLPALSSRGNGNYLLLLALGVGVALTSSSVPQATAQWAHELCRSKPDLAALPYRGQAAAGDDAPAAAALRPATNVKVISCEALPNVPGKSLTTMIVDFPPLASSAPHRHPGSVTAIVLQGRVRSQMEGGPAITYRQGQTWSEAPYALHVLAENPDALKPAQLLAIFVTDSTCGPLVIPEPAAS